MTILFTLMLSLTLIDTLLTAPRVDSLWMNFDFLAKEGDKHKLLRLLKQVNRGVIRHLICAIIAVLLVAVLMYAPTILEQPEQLATIMGIYAIVSIIFAYIECLLAQEISHLTSKQPEKVENKMAVHTPELF